MSHETSDLSAVLTEGIRSYQAGDLSTAKERLQQVLRVQPHHADVLCLLGMIARQQGDPSQAVSYLQRSLIFKPQAPETYNNLGNALQDLGQIDQAIRHYREALKLKPHYADALNNLGSAYRRLSDLDAAIDHYRQALKLNSRHVDALNNLGVALWEQGRQSVAIQHYQKALTLKPDHANAKTNLEEVIAAYRAALAQDPNHADAHNNLAVALFAQNNLQEALHHYQEAIRLRPEFPQAHQNAGVVLWSLNRVEEAITHLRRAIALKSDYADAYNVLGVAYHSQGNLLPAIACFEQAFALDPNCVSAPWNRSLALLSSGDLKQGFAEYEWRWKQEGIPPRTFAQPLWDGSDLTGKTILLYAEQGLGDTIQFIRYVPQVAEMGGRVIVECQEVLVELFQGIPGIAQLIARGKPLPEFDVHAPFLSLPHLLGTTLETIPTHTPYLQVPKDKTLKLEELDPLLAEGDPVLKVGIVWAGNPDHKGDRFRSTKLEHFQPLLGIPGVRFYSLQKGPKESELKTLPEGEVFDLAPHIQDFADTACLIQQLDLIITVDTSVGHLAGALGKPVWLLLSYSPDWRWLRERKDSPWYPTHQLYRQPSMGDWQSLFQELSQSLTNHVEQRAIFQGSQNLALIGRKPNREPIIHSFAVVVPIFNSSRRGWPIVERTLKSIEASLHYFRENYCYASQVDGQIILVDDASTDDTYSHLENWSKGKSYVALLRHSENRGQAAARNTGANATSSKALFFCDDDDLYFKEHILQCWKTLNTPLTVQTGQDTYWPCRPYPMIVKTGIHLSEQLHLYWQKAVSNTCVINLCLRREAFDFIGGFPEEMAFRQFTYSLEDQVFAKLLSSFFFFTWIENETVEHIRYPGNHFDRQLQRFQATPGQYPEVLSIEQQNLANEIEQIFQSRLENLQQKLEKMRSAT
ncbi:tetratricopeptide repeat protein [Synechococcus sp. Nb3U1]|uniref:tetratricopeptide repeat protein n=1 Tax=Synechococcus sp. Nb3U1 TaxID=1914529 RepID=UPI003FCC9458|nr:tetratricopeptide repeat protein [Synechococcus sp. Nb3U1]